MTVALGEVCSVRSSVVDPTEPVLRDLPHVAPHSIERDSGHLGTVRSAAEDGVTSGKYRFESGDILYSKIRPNLNKVARVAFSGLCSADMYALVVNPDQVDSGFLVHLLRSSSFVTYATSHSGRANIPKLNRDQLLRFSFDLPSLSGQRRIASVLDCVEAIHERRRTVVGKFEDLRRSLFRSLVGADHWRAVTPALAAGSGRWELLTDVAELATGHTPDRNRPEYWDGDIPWISLPEIRGLDGRQVDDTEVHISPAGVARSSAVVLPVGTVCFSRTASVGFVTKMGNPMATSQDFHNWVPGEHLDPDYLMAALRFSRDHLLSASDGSIHQTIYQRTAQRFRIFLPPIEDQRSFAASSVRIATEARRALRALDKENELFASLQARAFRGEL